jgi:hypothetical protein
MESRARSVVLQLARRGALPLIQEQLTSDNANLRAVAVDSLRHIDGEQVDVLLAHSLGQDNSKKMAAGSARSERPLSVVCTSG